MKTNKYLNMAVLFLGLGMASCNDLLDVTPLSSVTPESYLNEESQLEAYVMSRYGLIPNSWGDVGLDKGTDNEAGIHYWTKYTTGDYKVAENGGVWEFSNIYQLNYFLCNVEPKFEAGQLSGSKENIKHLIGEAHFLRACEYFNKLKALGDFPIITEVLQDDMELLVEKSKRMPRNEVARFILSDLDIAAEYMKESAPDGNKNRLYRDIAYLMKSRVALFEGTWLKYFKGTAFVPNGEGWPGKEKEYNKDYQYPSGSIDNEINWFLDQAIDASDKVASKYSTADLTPNNGVIMDGTNGDNPYTVMFSAMDMSGYNEILLWRDYDEAQAVRHNRTMDATQSCNGYGVTRGYIQSYLMTDGLPWYVSDLYKGDNTIESILENRDNRISLFIKRPGMVNIWLNVGQGTHGIVKEGEVPDITNGAENQRYTTGYVSRKYWYWDHPLVSGGHGVNGVHIFRLPEAYLNYMEAYYERNGHLDSKCEEYWKALRRRAGVDEDFNKTIQNTDMQKEAELDWGAYSAGQVLADKTLYNIRRERRDEFLGEGFRESDLKRWRALEQMITKKYHIEGFKLWNTEYPEKYKALDYDLIYDEGGKSNVSSPSRSDYLRPYEIYESSKAYDGYTWHMAHYLEPIAIKHFIISSASQSEPYDDSPIYQNPYWGLGANTPALK